MLPPLLHPPSETVGHSPSSAGSLGGGEGWAKLQDAFVAGGDRLQVRSSGRCVLQKEGAAHAPSEPRRLCPLDSPALSPLSSLPSHRA